MDGHEREDVVKSQDEFLEELKELRETHLPPPSCADERAATSPPDAKTKKTLVLIYVHTRTCSHEHVYKFNDITTCTHTCMSAWEMISISPQMHSYTDTAAGVGIESFPFPPRTVKKKQGTCECKF